MQMWRRMVWWYVKWAMLIMPLFLVNKIYLLFIQVPIKPEYMILVMGQIPINVWSAIQLQIEEYKLMGQINIAPALLAILRKIKSANFVIIHGYIV